MKLTKIKCTQQDQRGSITDIIEQLEFNGATMIFSKAGSIRGNHYHKQSIQHIYVLEGKMISRSKKIETQKLTLLYLESRCYWKTAPQYN